MALLKAHVFCLKTTHLMWTKKANLSFKGLALVNFLCQISFKSTKPMSLLFKPNQNHLQTKSISQAQPPNLLSYCFFFLFEAKIPSGFSSFLQSFILSQSLALSIKNIILLIFQIVWKHETFFHFSNSSIFLSFFIFFSSKRNSFKSWNWSMKLSSWNRGTNPTQ